MDCATAPATAKRKLTLEDILDLPLYERERSEILRRIIRLKRPRRVALGRWASLVFENRETVWFQVQEVVRAGRLTRAEEIQAELDIYNPLIPGPGELSATLFLELDEAAVAASWARRLAGIERCVELQIGHHSATVAIPAVVNVAYEPGPAPPGVANAVNYLLFFLDPAALRRFALEQATLAVGHPAYKEGAVLSAETKSSLLKDFEQVTPV